MLKGVSESARRQSRALSYIPDSGTLLAGSNREYRLDSLIAEGGEGRVFDVKGHEELVAKIYKEIDLGRKAKLQLMVSRGTRGLRKVCAWPLSPLSDSGDETVGFVMENLSGWEPLHNAYQIRSRLKLFPHHTYAFLVRSARNLATCVHHLHEEGLVIGDLNESNVFVNGKAMVKLIDADSFQIECPTAVYPCKVGKSELMPPELQGHSFEGVIRTPEHDRFSLAVLIFQTLVFGRHPFAGTTAHHHEFTLETCIENGYYAFTRRRAIPVNPPPNLSLDWLPQDLRDLFEQAFDPQCLGRPTAKDWYFALRSLENSLKTCADNPSHQYWAGVSRCPWCDLEDIWKIALFRPALSDPDQEYEVGEILARISAIPVPADSGKDVVGFDYKGLPPAKLGPWEAFFGRASKNWGWFIFAFFQIVNMLTNNHGTGFLISCVAVVVVLVGFGVFYSRSEGLVKKASKRLGGIAERWKQEADPMLYMDTLAQYEEIANSLRDIKTTYEKRRQQFIEKIHAPELDQYLAKYSILIADAGPTGSEKLSYLFDNGVKTAADITQEKFRVLPRILPNQEKQDLFAWRKSLEMQFWKSHNYKLTIHQERNLIVEMRKDNDRMREELEQAPGQLEELAERLRSRQEELSIEAKRYVEVLQQHGPKLLALEGKKAT